MTDLEFEDFDEFVDLIRIRLGIADTVKPDELHSFKTLMEDHADAIPPHWYHDAFDELDALGHLDPASSKTFGDAGARLSAHGRYSLRTEDEP